jgi:hypothetical protein
MYTTALFGTGSNFLPSTACGTGGNGAQALIKKINKNK